MADDRDPYFIFQMDAILQALTENNCINRCLLNSEDGLSSLYAHKFSRVLHAYYDIIDFVDKDILDFLSVNRKRIDLIAKEKMDLFKISKKLQEQNNS